MGIIRFFPFYKAAEKEKTLREKERSEGMDMRACRAALSLILCALVLFACAKTSGPSEPSPDNPVTLTLWHYYAGENQRALEEAVSAFNRGVGAENGITVCALAKGSIAELEAAVTNSAMGVINAEPMPELFSCYPDKALELDALGVVQDLNGYFSQEEKALYVESFLSGGELEGGALLTLPVAKSTELTFVNATGWAAFAAARGLSPEALCSWEGVYATAREYYIWSDEKTPEIMWDGQAFMGMDSLANFLIVGAKQLGVDLIDGTGKRVNLDETALRRVFEIYYQGMSLGYFSAAGRFRSDDIKSGTLIAYVGASSSAAYFPTWIEEDNRESPIELLTLPYPGFEGCTALSVQQGADICMAKSTPEKEAGAALFLKWLTAPERNIALTMTSGYLPVQSAAYEGQGFTPALQALREGGKVQANVAQTYETALHQIISTDLYTPRPFAGSYSVRNVLQSTLNTLAEEGRTVAHRMKIQGMSEAEILDALHVEETFQTWLDTMTGEMERLKLG